MLICWLCFTSHGQRGHLETAPPFIVPCEGGEARFLHRSHRESNPGPSRGSPLHYRCLTTAPRNRNFKNNGQYPQTSYTFSVESYNRSPCRVGSVGSVSASRTVGREFASRPGHTKDHNKNGTNCLPAWHAMR